MEENFFTARDRAELQRVIDEALDLDFYAVKLGFKTTKDEVYSMMRDLREMAYYEDENIIRVAKVFFE